MAAARDRHGLRPARGCGRRTGLRGGDAGPASGRLRHGDRARVHAPGDACATCCTGCRTTRSARPRARLPPETGGAAPRAEAVRIPAGVATLGAARGEIPFGWDNEFPKTCATVPAFTIDATPVTNADFLAFVEAGGYGDAALWSPGGSRVARSARASRIRPSGGASGDGWLWVGQFGAVPLPPSWPVWVSHAEASAYARWKGRRLPTEAEYHRAAFGTPAGTRTRVPVGRRGTRARARQLRRRPQRPRSRRLAAPGSERVGRARARRETAGSGRRRRSRRSRASRPCRSTRRTRRISSTGATSSSRAPLRPLLPGS